MVKTRFPNNYSSTDTRIDVLKNAVIVGENAGGKSNFVKSLSYLWSLFKETDSVKAYGNTVNTNNNADFCTQENNTLQVFDIEIFIRESGIKSYIELIYRSLNLNIEESFGKSSKQSYPFGIDYKKISDVMVWSCYQFYRMDKRIFMSGNNLKGGKGYINV